jgi:TPR repeat protein
VLLWEQGRADEARLAFGRADRLGHAAAPTNLGAMLEGEGNPQGAEECYRRADERGDAHGAFNLAALLEQDGDHVGALRAYRRASRRGNPEIAEMARAAAADLSRLTTSPATLRPDGGGNGGGNGSGNGGGS